MKPEKLPEIRARLCGVWVHDFAAQNGTLKGAWELKTDGTFNFRWKEAVGFANVLRRSAVTSWEGEWSLTRSGERLHLVLMPNKVTIPLQYAFDAAFLMNPATAMIAAFRAVTVIAGHAVHHKIKSGFFRFAGNFDISRSGVGDSIVLDMDLSDLGKRSIWPGGLASDTGLRITWERF
ncbi:hypothetical protein ACWDYJ_31360 [Streptomyces sp. NPDC003042]